MKQTFFDFHSLNVRKVLGLGAMTLALAILPACSDDDITNGGGDEPEKPEFQTSNLKVVTDPAGMPLNLFNYYSKDKTSRTISPDFKMPPKPNEKDYNSLDEYVEGSSANTQISKDQESQLKMVNQNVYVSGHWKLTGVYGSSDATVWVLPGATLELPAAGFWIGDGKLTIYNYGTLKSGSDTQECNLGGNLAIFSSEDIAIKQLALACEFWTDGALIADNVHLKCTSDVWVNCKIEVTKQLHFDCTSVFHVGYITAEKILLSSTPDIIMMDGGYMTADILDIRNPDVSQIYTENNDKALIEVGTIRLNYASRENLMHAFRDVYINCTKWEQDNDAACTVNDGDLNASVKLNKFDLIKDENTNNNTCAPIFIKDPNEGEDEKPSLETIGTVTTDHKHPISATCIQFSEDGSKAYVSWHERGKGIHGCVEVVEFDNAADKLNLLAWAEDPMADYNHILLDGNRLLVAGHTEEHGIIGEIELQGGTFDQGSTLRYEHLKGNRQPGQDKNDFYGGDGNCIIRNGNYISVASHGGLHTLNSDLTRINEGLTGALKTPGSAKHLSINGNSILELNLTQRGADLPSSTAELRLFEATDYKWSNPTIVASNLEISPVDGKNTIALDSDGSMYVCLSKNGVRKYKDGSYVEIKSGSPANGLAIDSKYLYVAFGKGLYIYDKNDFSKPVVKYTHVGREEPYPNPGEGDPAEVEASCNYVAVKGDIIYLAYGRYGFDVLRFKNAH